MSSRGDASIAKLAAHLEEVATQDDVLLVLGDNGNNDQQVRECLKLFEHVPCRKAAIAGNHDVWAQNAQDSSWARYLRQSHIFRVAGFHPLEDEPLVVGNLGVAGAMGWHDRTFRDSRLDVPEQSYVTKHYPGYGHWVDARYVSWGMSDEEFVQIQRSCLQRQIDQLQGDQRVSQIIVGLHHLPVRELLLHPRALIPKKWRFLNAFLGSTALNGPIVGSPKVTNVFCGHIHMQRKVTVGTRTYVSIGSDYPAKQIISWDPTNPTKIETTIFPTR